MKQALILTLLPFKEEVHMLCYIMIIPAICKNG